MQTDIQPLGASVSTLDDPKWLQTSPKSQRQTARHQSSLPPSSPFPSSSPEVDASLSQERWKTDMVDPFGFLAVEHRLQRSLTHEPLHDQRSDGDDSSESSQTQSILGDEAAFPTPPRPARQNVYAHPPALRASSPAPINEVNEIKPGASRRTRKTGRGDSKRSRNRCARRYGTELDNASQSGENEEMHDTAVLSESAVVSGLRHLAALDWFQIKAERRKRIAYFKQLENYVMDKEDVYII